MPKLGMRFAFAVLLTAIVMGVARLLWFRIGEQRYPDWYRKLWEFCDRYIIDYRRGGWFPELDRDNRPMTRIWEGKTDLYHVYQATLCAMVPAELGLATWAGSAKSIGEAR